MRYFNISMISIEHYIIIFILLSYADSVISILMLLYCYSGVRVATRALRVHSEVSLDGSSEFVRTEARACDMSV